MDTELLASWSTVLLSCDVLTCNLLYRARRNLGRNKRKRQMNKHKHTHTHTEREKHVRVLSFDQLSKIQ